MGSSRAQPACRGEAHFAFVNVRLKGGSYRSQDLFPGVGLCVLKDSADGPDACEVFRENGFRQCAGDIDSLNFDVRPTAFPKNGANPVRIREGELSGLVRFPCWEVGQKGSRGPLGRRHERVLRWSAPRENVKRSIVHCSAAKIGECLNGVFKEHHAETRHDEVEACRLE